MIFKNVNVLNEHYELLKNQYVGIKRDTITYIGDTMPEEDFGTVYDGENRLMIPGFVNNHTHLAEALMKDLNGIELETAFTDDEVFYSAKYGVAEALQKGITTLFDASYRSHKVAEALYYTGIKALMTEKRNTEGINEEAYSALMEYHGKGGGRVLVAKSAFIEDKKSKEETKDGLETADDLLQVIFFEEDFRCAKECSEKTCLFSYVDGNHGTFFVNPILPLKENLGGLKLVLDPMDMKEKTDLYEAFLRNQGLQKNIISFGSTRAGEMSLFCQMKTLKEVMDQLNIAIDDKEIFKMATKNGAITQGKEDTGILQVGNKADFMLIDMIPGEGLLNQIITEVSEENVVLTVVSGQILYKNGAHLSIDMEEVSEALQRLKERFPEA